MSLKSRYKINLLFYPVYNKCIFEVLKPFQRRGSVKIATYCCNFLIVYFHDLILVSFDSLSFRFVV